MNCRFLISSIRAEDKTSSLSRAKIQSLRACSAATLRKGPNPMKGEVNTFTLAKPFAIVKVSSVEPLSKRMTSSKEPTDSNVALKVSLEFFVKMQIEIT